MKIIFNEKWLCLSVYVFGDIFSAHYKYTIYWNPLSTAPANPWSIERAQMPASFWPVYVSAKT